MMPLGSDSIAKECCLLMLALVHNAKDCDVVHALQIHTQQEEPENQSSGKTKEAQLRPLGLQRRASSLGIVGLTSSQKWEVRTPYSYMLEKYSAGRAQLEDQCLVPAGCVSTETFNDNVWLNCLSASQTLWARPKTVNYTQLALSGCRRL